MKKRKNYKRERAIARQKIRDDVTAIMRARRARPKLSAVLKIRFWQIMAWLFVRRRPVRVK